MNKKAEVNQGLSLLYGGCLKAAAVMLSAFLVFLFFHGFTVSDQMDYMQEALGRRGGMIVVFFAFCFVCMLFYGAKNVLLLFKESQLKLLACLLLGCMVVLQLVFVFYFKSMYLWDGAFVIGAANSLVETGSIAEEAFYYLSVYKNQHPFVVFTAGLLFLGKKFGISSTGLYLLLNVINVICIDTAIFFLLKLQGIWLMKHTTKEQLRRKVWLLLLFVLNPFVYVFAAYYYTITLSLPFFMAGCCCAFKVICGNKRYVVPSGILFGAGFALRATTIIPGLAFFLVAGLLALIKRDGKRLLQATLVFVITIVSGSLLMFGAERVVGIDTTNTAFPTTHWIMMSLTSPGCHNEEDEAFTASFATKEEKEKAVDARLRQKLKELGIGGYAKLVVDKIKYTWESGNHSYAFFTGNAQRTDGAYEWIYGSKKELLAAYGQGYYLFLLFFMIVSIVKFVRQKADDKIFLHMAMQGMLYVTLLGGFLFYILWETGTQYSLVFFPLFFVVAAEGSYGKSEWLEKIDYKIGGKAKVKGTFAYALLCILVFVFFTAFMYTNRHAFIGQIKEKEQTVVLQLLANAPMELTDHEELIQKINATKSFDKLIFQFRNFVSDRENDSVYKVKLVDTKSGKSVFEEEIKAKDQPVNGAFAHTFAKQKAGTYELKIRKIAGAAENNLSFVTYQMGGYDAYQEGQFLINEQPQERDLMFGIYQTVQNSHMTVFSFCILWLVCFLIFLFFEFCCILYKALSSD